jgi:hypothetical protein
VPSVGSFEDWTLIREALIWLNQPDPATTREHVQDDDPVRAALAEIMDSWWDCFESRPMKLVEAVRWARANLGEPKFEQLLAALAAVCPGGHLNLKSLGWWFKHNTGKVVNNYRFFRQKEDAAHGARITLGRVDPRKAG